MQSHPIPCPPWILELEDHLHNHRYAHRGDLAIAFARIADTLRQLRDACRHERTRTVAATLDLLDAQVGTARSIGCMTDQDDDALVDHVRAVIVEQLASE
jgi:hypothetical protein